MRKPRKPRKSRKGLRKGLRKGRSRGPITVNIEVDVGEAVDRVLRVANLYDKSAQELWDRVQDRLRYEVLPGNLDAGGRPERFAPLAESTQNIRQYSLGAARREGPILFRRGDLRNSLEIFQKDGAQLAIGSRHPFARMHERGYTTNARSRIPNKRVPARPWIHRTAQHAAELIQDIEDFLLEDLE